MEITQFFAMLGAPLANQRWSWGSVREDGVVFLRVWQDRKRKVGDKWYLMVTHNEKYKDKENDQGNQERQRHVELIKKGAPCYMVMCLAKDAKASPRQIKSFNKEDVFVGGELLEMEGDYWIEMAERINAASVRT